MVTLSFAIYKYKKIILISKINFISFKTQHTMKHKSAWKQFCKDCVNHFDKTTLTMGLPQTSNPFKVRKHAKTTENSPIPNKF